MKGNMKYPEDFINKVICGDCLDVMPLIPDKTIDMILCDLPYQITSCKWDTIIPFETLWEQYKRIIKDNGAIVLTASQPFTSALVMSNIKMFKYCYTWVKTKPSGFQNAKRIPMKKHEDILVFYNSQPIYNQQNLIKLEKPIKSGRARMRNDEQHHLGVAGNLEHKTTHTGWQDSVLYFANPSGKGHLHPTQKPVALFEYLIKTYTSEGDLVLDNCLGSGTTAVACKKQNRQFIGIEKELKYCKVAEQRLAQEMLL
jgi:site-specific DNA-methyltransferase (adenine-specific)